MKPLLLEIGTEEIPARFISKGLTSLKEEFIKLFNSLSIDYGKISEYATPRRLTICVKDVSEEQKERTKETIGPPKKSAYDNKGAPTKAAIGFAKSLNIDIEELKIVKTERGEYLSAMIVEKGRATGDVLAEALPELITSLQFPKTMRWGNSTLRFVRPIRWILALFGADLIPFELDGLKSGNLSYGHRFISPEAIEIEDPSNYLPLLLKNHVIADSVERKRIIVEEIEKIELKMNGKVYEDEELLNTVTCLVEYPTVVLGSFGTEYLSLPKELPITVMKTHQKYFSVQDKDGNLMPHFIVVSNTGVENNDTVRKGAERVLKARLEDAKFYYNDDRKIPLWDYITKLKKVTYQEELGSLYERAERMAFLCSFIADKLNFQAKEKLLRAAMLSKADLVTGIVREFPELQGYMGMIYAQDSGEDKEIAVALHEHYMPRFSGDSLPSSEMGSIISIADKMDNIASFFFLGLIPTGSEDPFALRRQAAGIINILQEKGYPLTLDILIEKSLQDLESYTPSIKSLTEKILKFFHQRLEGILLSQGYSYDIVNAVLSIKGLTINEIKQRVEALSIFRKAPEFSGLLTAAKRVFNILVKTKTGEVKEKLLIEPAEKELFSAVKEIENKLTDTNFRALFELERPINTFFDSVLVMDKKTEIKENRLALLLSVKRLFDSLGDFSKIVE